MTNDENDIDGFKLEFMLRTHGHSQSESGEPRLPSPDFNLAVGRALVDFDGTQRKLSDLCKGSQ